MSALHANSRFELKNASALSVRDALERAYVATDRQIWHEIIERTTGETSPMIADLFDIIRLLFLSDCQHKRSSSWKRSLDITFPVRVPAVWQRREVYEALLNLLHFASGDEYHLQFERIECEIHRVQPCLPFETDCHICLFSDGLDSLCGLTQRLAETGDSPFLAVTIKTHNHVVGRTQYSVGLEFSVLSTIR